MGNTEKERLLFSRCSPRTEEEPTRRDNKVGVKRRTLHSRGSGAVSGTFQCLFILSPPFPGY